MQEAKCVSTWTRMCYVSCCYFSPFFPMLGHISNMNITQRLPRWSWAIPSVQGLNLKDRWHILYLGLARAQLLTFLSTDDKRLSLKAAFWCVLKTKLNTLKGRRGKNLPTVLCIFFMRVDEREIDFYKSLCPLPKKLDLIFISG